MASLGERSERSLQLTVDHLSALRRGMARYRLPDSALEVTGETIDDLIQRSGDSYIWHRDAGATHRESPLLRERMGEAGVQSDARLAHGALGLTHALRAAFAQGSGMLVRGVADVRYSVPVFEGAHLRVMIESPLDDEGVFTVATDQLEPRLAITGRILYGDVHDGENDEAFVSLAEQQLFTLENSVGLLSALIGLWVENADARVLYMGQSLSLGRLVSPGAVLQAASRVTERQPGRRIGERITVDVAVTSDGLPVATGHSSFLVLDREHSSR